MSYKRFIQIAVISALALSGCGETAAKKNEFQEIIYETENIEQTSESASPSNEPQISNNEIVETAEPSANVSTEERKPEPYSMPSLFDLESLQTGAPPLEYDDIISLRKEILSEYSNIRVYTSKGALFKIVENLEVMIDHNDGSNTLRYINKDTLSVMRQNLFSIAELFDGSTIYEDLLTTIRLIEYSANNDDMSGLFLAHHILSDVNFWFMDYPADKKTFKTWEMTPSIIGMDTYYGLSKTLGNEYPAEITERISFEDKENYTKDILVLEIEHNERIIEKTKYYIAEDAYNEIGINTKNAVNFLEKELINYDPMFAKDFHKNIEAQQEQLIAYIEKAIEIQEAKDTPHFGIQLKSKSEYEAALKLLEKYYESPWDGDYSSEHYDLLRQSYRMLDELYNLFFNNDFELNKHYYSTLGIFNVDYRGLLNGTGMEHLITYDYLNMPTNSRKVLAINMDELFKKEYAAIEEIAERYTGYLEQESFEKEAPDVYYMSRYFLSDLTYYDLDVVEISYENGMKLKTIEAYGDVSPEQLFEIAAYCKYDAPPSIGFRFYDENGTEIVYGVSVDSMKRQVLIQLKNDAWKPFMAVSE